MPFHFKVIGQGHVKVMVRFYPFLVYFRPASHNTSHTCRGGQTIRQTKHLPRCSGQTGCNKRLATQQLARFTTASQAGAGGWYRGSSWLGWPPAGVGASYSASSQPGGPHQQLEQQAGTLASARPIQQLEQEAGFTGLILRLEDSEISGLEAMSDWPGCYTELSWSGKLSPWHLTEWRRMKLQNTRPEAGFPNCG